MNEVNLRYMLALVSCLALLLLSVIAYDIYTAIALIDSPTLAGSDLKVMWIPEGTQLIILDSAITLIDTVTDSVTGKRVITIVKGN